MLVLSRKLNESIEISVGGDLIVVKVLSAGKTVKLGIAAPESVVIAREEVSTLDR